MIYLISDIHARMDFKGLVEYVNTASDADLIIMASVGWNRKLR